MPKKRTVDIELGSAYGDLTVLSEFKQVTKGYDNKYAVRRIYAICRCGIVKDYSLYAVITGGTKSCGCTKGRYSHGLTKHPSHLTWQNMIARCYSKCGRGFHLYGGRGISVCDEWRTDFKAFYDWAIANGYEKGLYLDRIDNDGNYEPSNCRFVASKKSAQNRRSTKLTNQRIRHIRILYYQSRKSASELSKLYGVTVAHIKYIIRNNEWNIAA